MRRFLPDSIAGWVIVVLIGGLAASQVVTLAINYNIRSKTATVLEHFGLAERIADVVRLTAATPAEQRPATLSAFTSGTLSVSWSRAPTVDDVETVDDRAEMFSTVLQSALDMPNPVGEQMARTLLGSFLFRGDDVFKPVGVLSGGEKSRLALVRMLLDPPNLLLMDEPTTHLDMGSIDALVAALEPFEGTLVFISHDVHFIRSMAREVVHIDTGRLTPYAGDYQYYLDKTQATSARVALTASLTNHQPNQFASTAAANNTGSVFKTKEQKRAEAEARNARSRAKREVEDKMAGIENDLAQAEARQKEVLRLLQDPETYSDGGTAMTLQREAELLDATIERLTGQWETTAAKLEELMASAAAADN